MSILLSYVDLFKPSCINTVDKVHHGRMDSYYIVATNVLAVD